MKPNRTKPAVPRPLEKDQRMNYINIGKGMNPIILPPAQGK